MTRDMARGAGLKGWVRNEEDGSVLAELQGSVESVRRVLGEVRLVFSRNLVGVDEAEMAETQCGADFEVRR